MPLPATIHANAVWPNFRGSRLGPFEVGSALYAVTRGSPTGATSRVTVWKSTDGGETWAAQDAADQPLPFSTCISVARQGDVLYVAYADSGTHALLIKPFDATTDQWGTEVTGGPT